jgi:hypothetical protein
MPIPIMVFDLGLEKMVRMSGRKKIVKDKTVEPRY